MHPDPMVIRNNESIRSLESMGFFIGLIDDTPIPFVAQTFQFEELDRLVLFTDGMTEAINAQKQMFGREGLELALSTAKTQNGAQIVESISQAVSDHLAGRPFDDDVTILVVELQERRFTAEYALNAFKNKQYDKAIEAFSWLLNNENAENAQWRSYLADSYRLSKNFAMAIENYCKFTEKQPLSSAMALKLGSCYLKLEQYQMAYDTFDAAAKSRPDNAELWAYAAFAALKLNALEIALTNIDTAIALRPTDQNFIKLKAKIA